MPFTYAIGDVHGRLDLLTRAFAVIDAHSQERPNAIVTLGDYIDRGPDSAGVVAFLRAQQAAREALVCVKGNHEAMMVAAIRSGDHAHWFRNGGEATLTSYGGTTAAQADLQWMDELPVFHRDAQRVYVHGGLEPWLALEAQDPQTMMWIRNKFLEAPGDAFPFHVVHAHTPEWEGKPDAMTPERLPHRTNLDTRAYETGVLSVGVFTSDAPAPVAVLPVR